jgi:hypothetical protein
VGLVDVHPAAADGDARQAQHSGTGQLDGHHAAGGGEREGGGWAR